MLVSIMNLEFGYNKTLLFQRKAFNFFLNILNKQYLELEILFQQTGFCNNPIGKRVDLLYLFIYLLGYFTYLLGNIFNKTLFNVGVSVKTFKNAKDILSRLEHLRIIFFQNEKSLPIREIFFQQCNLYEIYKPLSKKKYFYVNV